ncbi:YihY family inner membrane protein [Auraticoccus sp. F435]|uniref:YihY family inner membrane protein n=1 Tax=Auraticoccus cholistanensis TaxID=2656650 RepID=A0A6A9UWZ9_9ACTN|nr:YihY/virulence factor BrkB family protein [Auraticoccus cholistanensis]MVA76172.1 YihY family inner membrane protein [Auraticoccus cholistanensis]
MSSTEERAGSAGVPGEGADTPREIPRRGWVQIAKRGWAEAKADQVPLLGAGVAFFAFLSLFPALVALVGLYGLFADPAVIATQVGSLTQALPEQARTLITDQISSLTSGGRSGLGISVVISILVALWSASGGVSNLMAAVNAAYDEEDNRGFVKKRGLALLLTVGAIIFFALVLALLAVVPPLLESLLGDSPVVRFLLLAARWVLLVVLIAVALAILYRVAPDRDAPKVRWVSVGAVVATLLWLVASIGFSIYVSTFGNYAKTYGVFAGIIVLLLWLWITSYAVLLGAEINAESEEQTAKDTTRGPEQPLGQRDAVKADSLPRGE